MILLNDWLKGESLDTFPLLGLESFSTFIKICEEVSKWALDDNGLANRSESYKVWVCWLKDKKYNDLVSILDRYKSMALMLHYLNVNIVENQQIGLYIKLDFIIDKWQLSYGITNNKKMYKVGEFCWNITIKLPQSEILKYINSEIEDFNPREHYLLNIIKKSIFKFDPGQCIRQDPFILSNECILSCQNLGIWTNNTQSEDEANKWLNVFKSWVSEQQWWNNVILKVKIRPDNWIDFIIKSK